MSTQDSRLRLHCSDNSITSKSTSSRLRCISQKILHAEHIQDYTYGDYVDSYTELTWLEN